MNADGFSLSALAVINMEPEEAWAALAGSPFRQLELCADKEYLGNWMTDVAGTRRRLEVEGMEARSLHSSIYSWDCGSTDEELWQTAVAKGKESFDLAGEVGAEFVVCHVNTTGNYEVDPAESKKRTLAAWQQWADYARRCGVKMAVENMPQAISPRPGMQVVELLEMIEGLGDHVGVLIDTGHSHCNGLRPEDDARAAGAKLMGLHIHDNDASADSHLVPGEGTIDWPGFTAALDAMDCDGPWTLETAPGAGGHVATLARLTAALDLFSRG